MNDESKQEAEENSWHVENGYDQKSGSNELSEENLTYPSLKKYHAAIGYFDKEGQWHNNAPIEPGQVHRVNVGFGQYVLKMSRDSWGAAKPGLRYNINSPVQKIRFTHTASNGCETNDECVKRCQQIQKYFMDLGFSDIPYNFMIGGDGVVYHGRGWNKQAARPALYSRFQQNCIDVAYIGNFVDEPIPYKMAAAGADFLKFGIKTAKVAPFFQVLSFIKEPKPP